LELEITNREPSTPLATLQLEVQAQKIMKTSIALSPLMSAELQKHTLPWLPTFPPEPSSRAGENVPWKERILVAEDDPVSRELICARLAKWQYKVTATQNGAEAMTELRKKDAPTLAIVDWMMPDMDGLEICRRVREVEKIVYIILLTARASKENIIEGLRAGADDYLVKPFHPDELHARILVGLRVMKLQETLADRVKALEAAALEIKSLNRQLLM
jgi:CheY-like chemotaxis protein